MAKNTPEAVSIFDMPDDRGPGFMGTGRASVDDQYTHLPQKRYPPWGQAVTSNHSSAHTREQIDAAQVKSGRDQGLVRREPMEGQGENDQYYDKF